MADDFDEWMNKKTPAQQAMWAFCGIATIITLGLGLICAFIWSLFFIGGRFGGGWLLMYVVFWVIIGISGAVAEAVHADAVKQKEKREKTVKKTVEATKK